MCKRLALIGALALCCGSSASAQEWARKMFDKTDHSFGSVARGAKVEHAFTFTNVYKEDVHVSGVRSSCGCTTPTVTVSTLKTHEKSAIVARFNTKEEFIGDKSATVTVTFDKPFFAEVQLHVGGYIRSDVVLTPGNIDLGAVDVGGTVEKQIAINYAGRSDWQIKDVLSANKHLEAELKRTAGGPGQVNYSLLVRLKPDAPVGYIKDQLTLVTNDHKSMQIPVDIEGRVVSDVSVSPQSLLIGVVTPGQTVTKQLVVKAKKPFKIVDVKCDDPGFSFEKPEEAKALHIIPVTFTAGEAPGKLTPKIKIETDLGAGAVPEISSYAEVVKKE